MQSHNDTMSSEKVIKSLALPYSEKLVKNEVGSVNVVLVDLLGHTACTRTAKRSISQ